MISISNSHTWTWYIHGICNIFLVIYTFKYWILGLGVVRRMAMKMKFKQFSILKVGFYFACQVKWRQQIRWDNILHNIISTWNWYSESIQIKSIRILYNVNVRNWSLFIFFFWKNSLQKNKSIDYWGNERETAIWLNLILYSLFKPRI